MTIWLIAFSVSALLIGLVIKKFFWCRIGNMMHKRAGKEALRQLESVVGAEKVKSEHKGSDLLSYKLPEKNPKNPSFEKPSIDPLLLDLVHDPALKGFWALVVRRKNNLKYLLGWLDKIEIWLGVSAGLLGMSIFAVFFNFWEETVKDPNSFAAVSYAIFFIFVVNGVYRYSSRKTKIERLEKELTTMQDLHEKHLENIKKQHAEEINVYANNLVKGETRSETVIEQNKSLYTRNEQLNTHIQELNRSTEKLQFELTKLQRPKSKLKFWT